jgi:hypothetical protein
MGRKQMSLDDRLAQLIAMRGTLTLRGAMHGTGVVTPDSKGGTLLCGHGPETAPDGRCLGCKREADQRLYRNRQYGKAMSRLVERGLVTLAGKDTWRYSGPPLQPPGKVKPRLPAEPARELPAAAAGLTATAEELTQALRSLSDAFHSADAARAATRGTRAGGHRACRECAAAESRSRAEHQFREQSYLESPADLASVGSRAPLHDGCYICDELEDSGDSTGWHDIQQQRAQMYRDQRAAGRNYAYIPNGRRILRDGALCECGQCEERVRARAHSHVTVREAREAARDRVRFTPAMTTATSTNMTTFTTMPTIDPSTWRISFDTEITPEGTGVDTERRGSR